MAEYMAAFGLGSTTGIGLDNERPGINPSSAWKQKRFGKPWFSGETVSISIGQGYVVLTPLQLAVAYGALGTGQVVRPRLVKGARDAGRRRDARASRHRPEAPDRPAEPRDRAQGAARRGGRGRRHRPTRAGDRARRRRQDRHVAGREARAHRGLSDKAIPWKYRDHAWFASIAPVDAPEIVVVVLAEHGGHGGSAAAPIAQRLLARWWEKQHAAPPPLEAAMIASPDEDAHGAH
jgi:penicillin-binding protein 2